MRLRALLAFVAVALIACGGGASTSSQTTSNAPLKSIVIATGIGAEASDLVAAIEMGFFKKHGIEAVLKPFANGNDALDLLAAGQADIGDSTEAGGIVRRAKGAKIYVAGMANMSGTANALVVRNTINSPQDLVGKKVGFPFGSSANYFFVNYVAHFNLDAKRITQVNAQPPELLAAFARGDIDAFMLWDPWPTTAVAGIAGAKILQTSGENNVYYAQQYWYFSQRMIDDPSLAVNALQAMVEGNTWMKTHQTEAAVFVAKDLHTTPGNALRLEQLWSWGHVEMSTKTSDNIVKAEQFLLSAGQIKATLPDLNNYLQPQLLKKADPQLVSGF